MSKGNKSSNVFTHTAGILAKEGLHRATVTKTEYRGKTKTKHGPKDMQMFVLQITQINDTGEAETAEIHQQYHRSLDPKAALVKFLAAVDIQITGKTVDFDDLIGKKLDIVVMHSPKDANGKVHANIQPLPFSKVSRVTPIATPRASAPEFTVPAVQESPHTCTRCGKKSPMEGSMYCGPCKDDVDSEEFFAKVSKGEHRV